MHAGYVLRISAGHWCQCLTLQCAQPACPAIHISAGCIMWSTVVRCSMSIKQAMSWQGLVCHWSINGKPYRSLSSAICLLVWHAFLLVLAVCIAVRTGYKHSIALPLCTGPAAWAQPVICFMPSSMIFQQHLWAAQVGAPSWGPRLPL